MKSGILRRNKEWDNVFQLKLKHIESLINVSQRVFYSILVFFGALIISLISLIATSPNEGYVIPITFVILIFSSIGTIWGASKLLQRKIDSYYNKLFYELLVGEMKDIKGISEKEYKKLTDHLKGMV